MSTLLGRGLRRSFGEEIAIDTIDIAVGPGQIHAIVGLNGAGKTTLMRMLTGMIRPDEGDVEVDGVRVQDARGDTWAKVGHMIETPFGYPELTVVENLVAAATLRRVSAPADAAGEMIERFELGHWSNRPARTLSMGNRQRLGLACTLVHRPQILVLDEPSNGLDPAGVVLVRDLIREMSARDAAVLVSSHHLDELARVADTITVVHRGRVVGAIDPGGVDLERRFFDIIHEADISMERPVGHG